MPVTSQQEPVGPAAEKPQRLPASPEDNSGSTAKALRILEAVTDDSRPTSIAELSAMLRLSKPTTHRIGTALENLGYLEREPGSRRFIEGKRLVSLALKVLQAASARGPRHGILQSLSETIGETCNLGVMSGTEVIYLDRVEAVWPLGLRFEPGSRVPLHCTSLGKLFLSYLPDDELSSFVSVLTLTRYTQNTITNGEGLAAEVAEIRRRGFSVDNQEFMSGVVCVAAPITADDGRLLAGIALSAPEARMTLEQARKYVPMLRDAARKLSKTFAVDGRTSGPGSQQNHKGRESAT